VHWKIYEAGERKQHAKDSENRFYTGLYFVMKQRFRVLLVIFSTAHPVQNSGHHAQGSVDFRSAVHRRTPTTPSATRSLRSTDALHLSVPWTRTETAKRAFCVAAPNVWDGTVDFVTPVRCQPSTPN